VSDGARSEPTDGAPAVGAGGPFVVYCGGCNPHVDRTAIARELADSPTFVRPGASVYLSGCPRACASEHRLTYGAPATAVVAGALVDGVLTPADDIAATVIDKLKE
jgi:hypothetical protein